MIVHCEVCGGTHYGGPTCPYQLPAPCIVCGVMTVFACSDCAIDSGGQCRIHVCAEESCRRTHEAFHAPMGRPRP